MQRGRRWFSVLAVFGFCLSWHGAWAQSLPPRRVVVSPASLDFRWNESALPVELKNTSSGSVTVMLTTDVSWASPASSQVVLSGLETLSVTINASRTGLASGTYAGRLTVQEQGSPLSPPPTYVDLSITACTDVATFTGNSDTDKFQNALDSNDPCILVTVKDNGGPWVVGPLTLARSGKQLYFESGVVVQAAKGFGPDDCLIKVNSVTDIVLEGDLTGTRPVLRMRRAEYTNGGGRRHCLSLINCERVTIRGLAFEDAGGDGIYIGGSGCCPSGDITIQDCVSSNNMRLGLGITHAENVLVENCEFNGSDGQLPQSGVDIEPNNQYNKAVGIVLRNCTATGNRGYGFIVSLHALDSTSTAVDVTLENCQAFDSQDGMGFWVDFRDSSVDGTVKLLNCLTDGSGSYALGVHAAAATRAGVEITDGVFRDGRNNDSVPPILIEMPLYDSEAPIPPTASRLDLNSCTLWDDQFRCPILARCSTYGSDGCQSAPVDGVMNVYGSLVAKYTIASPSNCDQYPELPNLDIEIQLVPSGP